MNSLELMGGKLQIYRRGESRFWQCSASVGGKQRRTSTKQESLEKETIKNVVRAKLSPWVQT